MKKNIKIVMTLGLTTSLVASLLWTSKGLTTLTYADDNVKSEQTKETNADDNDTEASGKKGDIEYILCDANGEARKYIVKDDAENKLNYMDNDSSFPINAKVVYEMDGKEMTAEEVEKKSGDINIKYSFEADSSDETYSFASIMVLNEDKFDKIAVDGGKVISDGDKSVIIGFGMMPKEVTVMTKAKEFHVEMMYAVATNSLLGDINLEDLDFTSLLGIDVNKLKDTLGELKAAGEEIDGNSVSLLDGVGKLTDGISQLSDGLNTLDDNSDQLNAGARQVFMSLLDMANSKIKESGVNLPTLTIDNYAQVLDSAIAQASKEGVIKTARNTVEGKVRLNKEKISAEVTKAVIKEVEAKVEAGTKKSIMEAVLASQGMTMDQYVEALKAGMVTSDKVDAIVNAKMQDPAIQAKMKATLDEKLASNEVQTIIHEKTEEQIKKLTDENMNAPEVQGQIQAGIARGSQGAAQLKELKAELDSYNKFYRGLKTYTDGVAKAAEGANTINDATSAFTGNIDTFLNDDTLGLLNDADEIIDKTKDLTNKESVKYIFKFDSVK